MGIPDMGSLQHSRQAVCSELLSVHLLAAPKAGGNLPSVSSSKSRALSCLQMTLKTVHVPAWKAASGLPSEFFRMSQVPPLCSQPLELSERFSDSTTAVQGWWSGMHCSPYRNSHCKLRYPSLDSPQMRWV